MLNWVHLRKAPRIPRQLNKVGLRNEASWPRTNLGDGGGCLVHVKLDAELPIWAGRTPEARASEVGGPDKGLTANHEALRVQSLHMAYLDARVEQLPETLHGEEPVGDGTGIQRRNQRPLVF
ncbi:MAG: hypothetical protein WAV45_15735 [Propionibacteriaceae bacterium]